MTKLDEAIYYADTVFVNAESVEIWDKSILRLMLIDESKMADVIRAARAYADLLKLAPEIGALVEAGNLAYDDSNWYTGGFKENGRINQVPIEPTLGVVYGAEKEAMATADFIVTAANTRPTLKAIHDNLKMWGE